MYVNHPGVEFLVAPAERKINSSFDGPRQMNPAAVIEHVTAVRQAANPHSYAVVAYGAPQFIYTTLKTQLSYVPA